MRLIPIVLNLLMKTTLFFISFFFSVTLFGQKFGTDFPKGSLKEFFNNSNNELCMELYKKNDALSEYRVFLVLEELDENDIEKLHKWHTLSSTQKSSITQRWSNTGRRVEVERFPYLSYPPVFPGERTAPVLIPVKRELLQTNPWYPYERPF